MPAKVPERPSLDGLEPKWSRRWEADGTFRFDRTRPREDVYSIDTPPPTVSGSLHIGHVLSYTHTDVVARFRRMRGAEVFYPMGWDDNGVPTERRVQNHFEVRCDPTLPYDPGLDLSAGHRREPLPVSRPNFVELCHRLTAEDEQVFEDVWRHLGLSVDWSMAYATIDDRSRRASQRSFLRLVRKGAAYLSEAPTLWDVDFQTAVAQAELEDREVPGAYVRVRFERASGSGPAVEIETTRPELIPACVALVAHPDDGRYRRLFGSEVLTPLFGVRVPVVAHELADPEKGSGIAMICTFGDTTDVVWWRQLRLPLRPVVGRDGRLLPIAWGEPGWETDRPDEASAAYSELEGLTARRARSRIAEMLEGSGELVGEPRAIVHPVKFFERGERPLEIVTSRQWFIRLLDAKEPLVDLGRRLRWHPGYMAARYESWINGLNSDWSISRQRYFGIPFPVWYRVGAGGAVDFGDPILAAEADLPVDPSTDVPAGYHPGQRGAPGGFVGDPDILDTWATSSLTPMIAGGWEEDPDLFERVFPMDLRPQAHDIIRTWLFSTVVRSYLELGTLPWSDAAISGFVLDPDRKKMSKSKGNVVTPLPLLREHGADAVRYWASNGRPGADTAVDEGQIKVGRRLAIKVLNASRFVLSRLGERGVGDLPSRVSSPLDASVLGRLAAVVEDATTALEGYDYTRALERGEEFFWDFCDNYLELVKGRAYGSAGEEAAGSAQLALSMALSVVIRLFAPFLPFVTEEVWSWWQEGSVHRASWPDPEELAPVLVDGHDPLVFEAASEVLSRVRRAKTESKLSMRAPVERLEITGTADRLHALRGVEGDLSEAGVVETIEMTEGLELAVRAHLAPSPAGG